MRAVAVCSTSDEAQLVLDFLTPHAIHGHFVDVPADKHGPTMGGVSVCVADVDCERAIDLLRANHSQFVMTQIIEAEEDAAEPAIINETVGDAMAWRAWQTALFGIIAFPPLLHLYSACLLLRLAWSNPPLSPHGQRWQVGAFIIDLLIFGVVGAILLW